MITLAFEHSQALGVRRAGDVRGLLGLLLIWINPSESVESLDRSNSQ